MAHKKDKAAHGTGATRTRSDSGSKRMMAISSWAARSSCVTARDDGFRPGRNAGLGKDDTIYAKVAGRVRFEDHGTHGRVISILPVE